MGNVDHDNSVPNLVRRHIAGLPGQEVISMVHLAPRAVAVFDNRFETDVYFAVDAFRLSLEGLESLLFPPVMQGSGLGVIYGLSTFPAVEGPYEALNFAKLFITPLRHEYLWYDNPVPVR